jgi:hypothetical protein
VPFTPLHLGPGAVFKAIGGRHFSFMVFGGSQVLMDIEPLIGIIRGWDVLHGYSHTIAGALAIGTVAGLIGRPISQFALEQLKIPHDPFTWHSSFLAAYVGTFSHVLFDAIMHGDMRPWWPILEQNGLLSSMTIMHLHILCLVSGVLGAGFVAFRALTKGRA